MKITVQPDVMRSLRENLNIPPEIAAKKAGVSIAMYLSWESLPSEISLSRLERLAVLYNRNWTAFLLERPANKIRVGANFRANPDRAALSTVTLEAVEDAERIMQLMADIREAPPDLKFLLDNKITLSDDPDQIAHRIRNIFGVTLKEQEEFQDYYAAYKGWSSPLALRGINICELPMPIDEVRAFTLRRDDYAVIVVNSVDAIQGRIFSLLHEFAHLLLQMTGVCDFHEKSRNHDSGVEAFCNKVAAAVLVPRDDFLIRISDQFHDSEVTSEYTVKKIAHIYGVSQEVIYRRLNTVGLITDREYETYRQKLYKEILSKKIKKKRKIVVSYEKRVIKKRGKAFVADVFDAYENSRITYRDIGKYLGVNTRHISKLQRELSHGSST